MLRSGLRLGFFWSLISLPLIIFVFPEITNFLTDSIEFSRLLLFIFWLGSLNIIILAIASPALYQLHLEKKVFLLNGLALMVNILGNFFLIPELGTIGAATSTLLGSSVSSLGIYLLCIKSKII